LIVGEGVRQRLEVWYWASVFGNVSACEGILYVDLYGKGWRRMVGNWYTLEGYRYDLALHSPATHYLTLHNPTYKQ
jgi:hypothetical protein